MGDNDGLEQTNVRRRQALDYLERHTVVSLATHGGQGLWAAALFYAHDGFDLFFLSAGHTRHAQNLGDNSRAAATIQENYTDWPAIQGIQLEGVVRLLAGEERASAIALYRRKYPFLQEAGPAVEAEMERVNWYCLTPDRLYFIDNSQGFGHRDEIELNQATS